MRSVLILAILAIPAQSQEPGVAIKNVPAIKEKIQAELPALEQLYKHLHQHPELAFEEVKTAERMAKELKDLGFEVTTNIGKTGVVGVLKNGVGPTILVRTDMDGLPVTEKTGVPYASKARTRDAEGKDVGLMHACGHDMHMTCWVGAARVLTQLKNRWQGTLVFIAQPAEEIGAGARAMLKDNLFTKFPRPDYCFGLHCDSRMPHGHIAYSETMMLANADSVDIIVRGKGGHGAAPHSTVDPVVLAAKIVLELQTLVSREVNPLDPAVVTVGSIHGGAKHNIIPTEVRLQLTVRSFKDEVRKQLLEGIERIAKACAVGARAPEPTVLIDWETYTPAVFNDAKLAKRTAGLFKEILGAEQVHLTPPFLGAEDFGLYGRQGVPIFFWFLGTMAPEQVKASREPNGPQLPSLHSDFYYPIPEPSIRTGVLTLTTAVMNLAGK